MPDDEGGHIVVLGDSRFAKALVRQQAAAGQRVVHAGREPVASAASAGIREVALGADPTGALDEAGAGRARLVVIDLADDTTTVGALASLLEVPGLDAGTEIVANVRDAALRRVLDGNLQALGRTTRPRIVSTASLTAGAAIAALRPHGLAYWRGQTRLHAVLIGFSRLGRSCFEELVLAGIAGDLERPRVTILDPRPDEVRQILDRDMPEIAASAEIVVAGFDRLTVSAPDGPLAAAEAALPLTLICVALDEAPDATGTALALARMQGEGGRAVAAVALVTEGHRAMFDLIRPPGRPQDLGRRWTVCGGIDQDPDILDLLMGRSDRLAARLHEAYRTRFGGIAGSTAPWADLAETYRTANRRAAAHLPLKLWTLGLREPGAGADRFAVEPHAHASVILPCAKGTQEDALLRRLSRIEHERWCAERRLDGWRFSEIRDDSRRLHPKLISFDDPRFTDDDIEKDADQIRVLFGSVVTPAPDGAAAPLVLGIVAGVDGIGVAAALDLCRAEPWRPLIVVSAILQPAECRILMALDRALAEAGRAWRLLVPELQRDNRDLRILPDEADRAFLQSCLARPTTRFAPLGGIVAPADLWADPSAPDPHAAAIEAYVTARASAIVDGDG